MAPTQYCCLDLLTELLAVGVAARSDGNLDSGVVTLYEPFGKRLSDRISLRAPHLEL